MYILLFSFPFWAEARDSKHFTVHEKNFQFSLGIWLIGK